ncbi:MAG: 1-acyl-sn-glycerol-3-phosphate acyltransferase [Bacteroidia bacterium]|nr:1-acyl-sn-glycerol-3-phosphate acyltransferase [Bacteroidia bacterium]
MISKLFARIILKMWGWKTDPNHPVVNKCVMIAAPHTSNIDFLIGYLYYCSIGVKINFLIKKDLFFFPFGFLLKAMGGVPVDRSSGNRMVEQVAKMFRQRDHFHLVITPEGTREKVSEWKKGFYYIARRAKVPIYIGYLDYKTKFVGFITEFFTSGDANADIGTIKNFYKGITPRHPERFTMEAE